MSPPPDRLSLTDWLAAITVVVVWGLNFIAVKTALGDLPPFLMTSLRFALVAALLAPFFRPRRDQIKGLVGIGMVLGVGHFGLLFLGLSQMEAATTAIVVQLGVPFSALLAWLAFGETLGVARGLGLIMAFAGVALLAGEPTLPHPLPLFFAAAAMMAWAVNNVLVKRIAPIHPMTLNGWMALVAAPALLALSLAFEDNHIQAVRQASMLAWGGVAFTVLGSTILAYGLWYHLLTRHPMNRVVPFTMLGPIIGALSGVVVLGETLSWQKLVGGVITIAGVAVIQFVGAPPQTTSKEPEPGM